MTAAETDLRDVAQRYCEGVYHARPEIFEEICHDRFAMTEITPEGGENAWDKASYLERVRGRSAFPGDVSAEILDVDIAGDEIARVHLWVDVPPRRYEDHLGFVRVNGSWKLLTKVFRTMDPSTVEA